MNIPRLPSLVALRAFEALVRQGSIGRAALELHVTHGAISHQIKKLEEELGVALIERQPGGAVRAGKTLRLTSAGHQLSQQINGAFNQLRDIRRTLQDPQPAGELRIICAPGLLSRMSALLDGFLCRYPDMVLHLLPTGADTAAADLVISFAETQIEGQRFAALGDLRYFPVASPKLLQAQKPLRHPRDLAQQTLLHGDDGFHWMRYFLAAGLPAMQARKNIHLPDAWLTIRAALAGTGVSISDPILAGEYLDSGRLLRLFDTDFPAPHPYFLIIPSQGHQSLAREFADWLMAELESLLHRTN